MYLKMRLKTAICEKFRWKIVKFSKNCKIVNFSFSLYHSEFYTLKEISIWESFKLVKVDFAESIQIFFESLE